MITVFAVLEYLVLFTFLQQFSTAASTLEMKNSESGDASASDVEGGVEYRSSLFGVYHCRVTKAAEGVKAKLQVRF